MENAIQFLVVFLAMAITDVFWTMYLMAVEERKSTKSGVWAMMLYISGAFVVTSYVNNPWMIAAAAVGSFTGTYFTIEYKKKQETKNTKP